ncbi:craniofacial development protein 2-like [Drosophila biarmipes]|uniref:craniofacial development protein 2-like n=1 Tax=Drosophila biarmipes TaxID=125945 RepID=UPI001CDA5A58|nr:craniofacial development protein 2-like [Drosophila biarmipes]
MEVAKDLLETKVIHSDNSRHERGSTANVINTAEIVDHKDDIQDVNKTMKLIEKDVAVKDAFYARLEDTYDRCPVHDGKLILGDFNAKVGRERIFDPTVGLFSLHETTSNNGLRLIDFSAARNMVVSSTRFRHIDSHNATWLSPDQKTRNQIDHVVIDGRHASSVMDLRTFRGVNIDSDRHVAASKIRMRLCRAKNKGPIT